MENTASFEKLVYKEYNPYDINLMVLPGTLQDMDKNADPKKDVQDLRRHFNLIYLLQSGIHEVQLGANHTWLRPNDLVIVPENMVYISAPIHNCIGYSVQFKTEIVKPLLNGTLEQVFPYFNLEAEHIINISHEESKVVRQAFQDIISEHGRFSPERDYLLRNYIHILLLRIREIYREHVGIISETITRSMKLANRFKYLMEKNFIEKRMVKQYACELHITPKYLADVVKKTFGKSPRQLINDMLLLEAKVLLSSTDLMISEVAHKLHFDGPSHFCHFIRQHSGLSPKKLKESL